jgi:hypothetical protein
MSGADDLSGRWHGFYSYGGAGQSCAFEAELRDHHGEIVGIAYEVAQFGPDPGATLSASIEGRRAGSAVDFAKTYDEVALASYTIHYAGSLAEGGNEIEGTWAIPGQNHGTFLMIREGGAEAEAERQVEESVKR